MSEIRNQLPGLLNTGSLRALGDKATSLFGFRLRSSGLASLAAPGKVADMQQNAKIAFDVVSELDTRLARLQSLGRQAESVARDAAAAYNGAAGEYNEAGSRFNWAAANYDQALAAVRANPDDVAARNRLHFAGKAYEESRARFDAARAGFSGAEERYNSAVADIRAVEDGIRQFEAAIPQILSEIGERMGLRSVFVEESRQDAQGRYTSDRMSFSEQSAKLLRNWTKTMKEGSEIKDPDAINPVTRRAFGNQRLVGGKNLVVGDEAIVVQNLGSIGLFRKLFQRMMEDMIATATRKHA